MSSVSGLHDRNASPIKRFLSNSNIFLTGGTGFMGILLLEKLLSSCPDISSIYVLIRSKRGNDVKTRLDRLFENDVFFRLKEQVPNFREKIIPVEGDCEYPELGICTQDRSKLIQEVNIVFHLAATVRFDETLRKASFINVRAVRDLMRLAQKMKSLKSFVHVSTAYSNCIHSFIKEEIYPPSMDYEKLLILTEQFSNDVVDSVTPHRLDDGNTSPIKRFLSNSNIFLTGGTGFMGILLLEKLLTSCPDISNIYVLIRSKRGNDVQTRLDKLFEDVVFSRLKEQVPNFREKIIPVEGDCEYPELRINTQDREMLIKEVDIVFHLAATVRFDESLRKASFINVRAVRDLMRLAQQMKNLKSFVHVSTAYANCIHSFIKEEIYPPSMDYEKLLTLTEGFPDEAVDLVTPQLLGKYPNTYTFTKQIGEDVVRQEGKGLPRGINRPSVVSSTYKEPLAGWTNSYYGPGGLVTACGVGLLRVWQVMPEVRSNMVPADMAINSIIATAWDVAETFVEDDRKPSDPKVYNFESNQAPILTYGDHVGSFSELRDKYFSSKSIWFPYMVMCRTRMTSLVAQFLLHTIPGAVMDAVLLCLGKSPMFLKTYKKVDKMIHVLSYFASNEWDYGSQNITMLKDKMSAEDQATYYCDVKNIEWKEYLDVCLLGYRIYLIKDPLDTIPEAQKLYKRLYWYHQLLKTVLVAVGLWIIWCIFSFIFK